MSAQRRIKPVIAQEGDGVPRDGLMVSSNQSGSWRRITKDNNPVPLKRCYDFIKRRINAGRVPVPVALPPLA